MVELYGCPIQTLYIVTTAHRYIILLGVCPMSRVDSYYILQSDNSMLGLIQSKMIWSESQNRWEIYNLVNNSIGM